MNNKFYLIPFIFMLVLNFVFSGATLVEADNVKDWLDDDKDIIEIEEQEVTDLKSEEEQPIGSKTGSLVFNLIKMVFALLLILTLIYLLLRFLNNRNKLGQQVKSLENLGGISVGQNKSVQIIRVGTRIYLLGVGDNVELLQEIIDDDVREELMYKDTASNNQSNNFLLDLFNRNPSSDNSNKNKAETKFKQLFSTELNKLKQTREEIIDQHTEKEDKHG